MIGVQIFSSFLRGGVLDAHLHAHYREGISPPENQLTLDSDPLLKAKIGNDPGGTFYPITFEGGQMEIGAFLESCRGGPDA